MSSLSCVIVDDDPISTRILEKLCAESDRVKVLRTFSSPTDAFNYLGNVVVDLLFLDIEMPAMSGLDLLRSLSHKPKVILTTVRPDYAVEAFDLEVLDYLVKPISFPRFMKAIGKLNNSHSHTPGNGHSHIFIKQEGRFVKLNFEDIIYIQAQDDYISIHTRDRRYLVYETLKKVEQKLDPRFLRVHRSYIINKEFVQTMEDNSLSLPNKVVPVSASYKDVVAQALNIS
jgi:two-component system, LytTR family, response regulator